MQILIREGSVARNLDALLPLINEHNYPFISFCTDDKHPNDIIAEGHIDYMVRRAIEFGIEPVTAIRMATINTAVHYNLRSMGAIAPGYKADLLVVENLDEFRVDMVFKDSKLVAVDGKMIDEIEKKIYPVEKMNTFATPKLTLEDFKVPLAPGKLRVIELFGHEVLTGEKLVEPKVENGEVISDIDRDVLKLTSISRYTKKKSISVAFATGSGLIELGGGLVISNNGKVVAELPLPIAGLMSDLSSEEVAERLGILKKVLKDFGSVLPDLFMTLSFVQLAVIPKLKLTNMGLVDVTKNKFVHLFEGR